MTVAPPTPVSTLAGLHDAEHRLDVAAHNVANASTEPFAPLRPDGTLDAPDTLDMPTQLVAVATAPIVNTATARLLRAQDTVLGSLLDVLA
jgi:hypothetical protein